MARENIPRWMTQATPSIGSASANQLRVVSPDDLNMASQMYGQLSNRMFDTASQLGMSLNYLHKDYAALQTKEAFLQGKEAIEKLRLDPNASKDGPAFRKNAEPIMQAATKGMGYFEGAMARRLLNQDIVEHSLQIGRNQVNQAAAEILKDKHTEWNGKNTLYLSQVDNTWSPEQKKEFITKVGQERRTTIPGMSEEQHQVLDGEFKKDYDAAELGNQLLRNNAFVIPKIRDKILSSKEFTDLQNDPEKLQRVQKLIGNGLQIYNSKAIFDNSVQKAAVEHAFNNFRSNYDNIQDPVKRSAFYKQAKAESKEYDVPYQRKLKAFGSAEGYEQIGNGFGGSKAANEFYYRQGINGEKDLSEMMVLEKNGKINRSQLNAFQAGAKMRNKAYDTYDKPFHEQVKTEFGFSLKPPRGKNAQFVDQFLPKNPSDIELKNYILEQKASLVGLKDDEYKKGLSDIMVRAKQKKMEIMQHKQAVYGNQKPSNILTRDYGTE